MLRNLSVNPELSHRVNDTEKSRDCLCLLSNFCFVDFQFEPIMLKVPFHLLSIHVVDVLIRYRKTSLPFLVAVCKIGVLGVEDAVYECEVIFNLLVAFDVEASVAAVRGCFLDGSLEVRHVEFVGRECTKTRRHKAKVWCLVDQW